MNFYKIRTSTYFQRARSKSSTILGIVLVVFVTVVVVVIFFPSAVVVVVVVVDGCPVSAAAGAAAVIGSGAAAAMVGCAGALVASCVIDDAGAGAVKPVCRPQAFAIVGWAAATRGAGPGPGATAQSSVAGRTAVSVGFETSQGDAAGIEALATRNRYHLHFRDA